jgi:hypothetical protein
MVATAPLTAPAAEPARLYRLTGELAAVRFAPDFAIALYAAEQHRWFPATPELVERALTLRGAPVQILVLGGPTERLLRIDPASDNSAPDAEERTHDMLHDWDELLHRLAR